MFTKWFTVGKDDLRKICDDLAASEGDRTITISSARGELSRGELFNVQLTNGQVRRLRRAFSERVLADKYNWSRQW